MAMTPEERKEVLAHQQERSHIWDHAIARIGKEPGVDARQTIHDIACKFGIELKA